MCLEIVHAMLRIVSSNWVTSAIQIFSRCYITFAICTMCPEVCAKWPFVMMVLSWSLTEVIRYTYFITESIRMTPPWLTVVRYSTFFVLYPTGASGEWLCAFLALPALKARNLLSLELPNALNFGFSLYALTIVVLIIYLPGLPYMYTHMMAQRKKHLGGKKKESPKH